MRLKQSIRYRLMRVILATSASVLLLTFAFFFLYEFFSYREITMKQLGTLSDIIASNSTAAVAFESHEEAHEILSALKAGHYITHACIYTKQGTIFSRYPDGSSIKDFPSKPGQDGLVYSDDYIEGYVPIKQGDLRVGTLYIKRSLADLDERLRLYSVITFIVIGLSFLLVHLLSQRLQRGISSPIISLSETALQISLHHNYAIRAKKQTDDEIGILTDAFNTMLTQIEIQNKEIEAAGEALHVHAQELEIKVNERTIEYKRQKDFAEIVVNSSLVLITVFDTETKIIGFNKKCEE
jgi:methyl-accepting chemotaxis protein